MHCSRTSRLKEATRIAAADAPRLPAAAAETTSWQRTWSILSPWRVHGWLSGTSSPGIWESQFGFSIAGHHKDAREALRRNTRLNAVCRCFSYVDCGKHKDDTCILKMLTRRLRGQLIRITTCVVLPVLALRCCISFQYFISFKRLELEKSSLDTAPSHQLCGGNWRLFPPFCGRCSSEATSRAWTGTASSRHHLRVQLWNWAVWMFSLCRSKHLWGCCTILFHSSVDLWGWRWCRKRTSYLNHSHGGTQNLSPFHLQSHKQLQNQLANESIYDATWLLYHSLHHILDSPTNINIFSESEPGLRVYLHLTVWTAKTSIWTKWSINRYQQYYHTHNMEEVYKICFYF